MKTFHLGLAAPYLKFFVTVKDYVFYETNINEFSESELCVANWKLYFFVVVVSTKKSALICRGTLGDMSQNEVTFSAILNVCLSALLDWGHTVQRLADWVLDAGQSWRAYGSSTPARESLHKGNSLPSGLTVVWRLSQNWESGHQSILVRGLRTVGVLIRPSKGSHHKC